MKNGTGEIHKSGQNYVFVATNKEFMITKLTNCEDYKALNKMGDLTFPWCRLRLLSSGM
jgi:hypothetical protein